MQVTAIDEFPARSRYRIGRTRGMASEGDSRMPESKELGESSASPVMITSGKPDGTGSWHPPTSAVFFRDPLRTHRQPGPIQRPRLHDPGSEMVFCPSYLWMAWYVGVLNRICPAKTEVLGGNPERYELVRDSMLRGDVVLVPVDCGKCRGRLPGWNGGPGSP